MVTSPPFEFHRDRLIQHILADDLPLASPGDDVFSHLGKISLQLGIRGKLVAQTAHQTAAHSRDFGWVQGEVLFFGHFDRHRNLILSQPFLSHSFNPHRLGSQSPTFPNRPFFSSEIEEDFGTVQKFCSTSLFDPALDR
jgi:hypothetical protein